MSGANRAFRLISAATTNETLIRASSTSGTSVGLISINAMNSSSDTAAFLKIYDKATTPQMYVAASLDVPGIAADIPILTYSIDAGKTLEIDLDVNCVFGLGIAITGDMADDDITAVGAGQILLNIEYNTKG